MSAPSLLPCLQGYHHYYELIRHSPQTQYSSYPIWTYKFPSIAYSKLPLFRSEPSLRSCHLYTGSPSWQLIGYIYMTYPFRSLTPPVLSYNRVIYDTSTMVHSHLIHLLRPHLTVTKKSLCRFHNAQHRLVKSKHLVVVWQVSLPSPCRKAELKKKNQFSFISTTALSIFKELFILYPWSTFRAHKAHNKC